MKTFDRGCDRGKLLTLTYNYLINIKPTSVESERVFSLCSSFVTKVRNRLNDDIIDALIYLQSYFLNKQNL